MRENPTLQIVKKLISAQFPEWSNRELRPVLSMGNDNRMYRLGEALLVRLPSAEVYVPQVKKEQKWLPFLAKHLSFKIPLPLKIGKPSEEYPWPWSIYEWVEGETLAMVSKEALNMEEIAGGLAKFLQELHGAPSDDGPLAGAHNFWRGGDLSVYASEVDQAFKSLSGHIEILPFKKIWQAAVSSKWHKNPVWVHGDLSPANILLKKGQLHAVIDFGCMGVGDPASDLTIAWTFFEGKSQQVFLESLNMDEDTIARAKGWALWKALIQLESKEISAGTKQKQENVLKQIQKDY